MRTNPILEHYAEVEQAYRWVWRVRIAENARYTEDGGIYASCTLHRRNVYGSRKRAQRIAMRVLKRYIKKRDLQEFRKAHKFIMEACAVNPFETLT